jgi:hypothetical protein
LVSSRSMNKWMLCTATADCRRRPLRRSRRRPPEEI